MYLMRIGPLGAEKPVARIGDDTYVDLSDLVADSVAGVEAHELQEAWPNRALDSASIERAFSRNTRSIRSSSASASGAR